MEVTTGAAGSVPAGYKQTEVGVIPEDWDVARLGTVLAGDPRNGYSGRSGKTAHGTPTLALSATTSGRTVLNADTVKRLEETLGPESDVLLETGDVLVQRSNTLELVGTTAVFDGPSGIYAYPDLMIRIQFEAPETAQWFWRFANSSGGRRYFVSVAAGSTGTMPKITGEKLRNMSLPLPPASEQRVVATALMDVDALLDALDRLIAKKRDIKQAAMQQLLTGQTRLSGFGGTWDLKRLDELGAWTGGMTPSTTNAAFWSSCDVPWISSGDVKSIWLKETLLAVATEAIRQRATTLVSANSIVMVIRSGILRKCLPVAMIVRPMAINQDIKALIPAKDVHGPFVLYALLTAAARILGTCLKAGTTVESVEYRWLKAFEVPVPPTTNEQTAIADVLTDMDAELAALEQRRAKTLALKQGMMQELLTGRTRLI